MADAFLSLPAADRRNILETAAARSGRPAAILEKDVWICRVLQVLFSIPDRHPMAFKGGTSLSKVYDVIDRFSEDVDITLDYRAFTPRAFADLREGESTESRSADAWCRGLGPRLTGAVFGVLAPQGRAPWSRGRAHTLRGTAC